MYKKQQQKGLRVAQDMTVGPIASKLILFSLPLLLGNVFQMLYNTVDVLVVGNFVSTQALAAVGATGSIVNILVFFFNGISLGASVLISRYFGAKDYKKLHTTVETTMAMTFLFSVLFTILGMSLAQPMLGLISTPEDVMEPASAYLKIYFAGISGLLIYNMGSGILRAVGDTTRPLLFLIFTSLLNIVLDLVFVLGLHAGIRGVAYATILSQFVSAFLILALLTRTDAFYKLTWNDLKIHTQTMKKILAIGLPTALQSTITSFSNAFVQGYINFFGSDCMAGWSCYNKLDQFQFLSITSMSQACTTFVSQNLGAEKDSRARKGTVTGVSIGLLVTLMTSTLLFLLSGPAIRLFTDEPAVLSYGTRFLRLNVYFLLFNTVNHVLAGAIRGRGDSKGPMFIMILCFVVIRQIYLFIAIRLLHGSAIWVGFGYPVGWMSCCILELLYYRIRYGEKKEPAA